MQGTTRREERAEACSGSAEETGSELGWAADAAGGGGHAADVRGLFN